MAAGQGRHLELRKALGQLDLAVDGSVRFSLLGSKVFGFIRAIFSNIFKYKFFMILYVKMMKINRQNIREMIGSVPALLAAAMYSLLFESLTELHLYYIYQLDLDVDGSIWFSFIASKVFGCAKQFPKINQNKI